MYDIHDNTLGVSEMKTPARDQVISRHNARLILSSLKEQRCSVHEMKFYNKHPFSLLSPILVQLNHSDQPKCGKCQQS